MLDKGGPSSFPPLPALSASLPWSLSFTFSVSPPPPPLSSRLRCKLQARTRGPRPKHHGVSVRSHSSDTVAAQTHAVT